MARKRESVDDVLDAIVWMRRKSKKHEAVDDFIDALLAMRHKTKKKSKKSKKTEKLKMSRKKQVRGGVRSSGSGSRRGG